MTLIEYARLYRYLFNWSIIPVKANSKIASVNWKKYQTELIGKGDIESLFKDHSLNIALVTGELSGVVVVDSDEYKNKGGRLNLNSPLFAHTPRGGRHLYFKYINPIQNSVNAEKAVDIRGDGGYVLLPPSAIDNRAYSWNTNPTKELISKLPLLQDEVLQTLRKTEVSSFNKFNLSEAIGITEGSRDDTLLRASLSLLNGIPEHEWQAKGYPAVQGVNNTFKPPLPDNDVQRIFRQACKRILNNPKQTTRQASPLVQNTNFKPKTFTEIINDVKERRKRGEAKGIESGYQVFDKYTGGFLPGQTYLFFGDTNTGKSCLALNFLIRMARTNNKVTYFDLENNAVLTTERMALIYDDFLTRSEWEKIKETDMQDQYMDKLATLPFHLEDTTMLNERFGAITFEAVETIIKEQAEQGCKIFGIDHLHYFEPSEKNYGYLQDIARKLNDLANELNITVLLVAHTRKGLLREKDGAVKVYRPTTDDIAGSGLISRHTKNVIGIMRNTVAEDPMERQRTTLFIDKTKTGLVGMIQLVFNPETLHFEEA